MRKCAAFICILAAIGLLSAHPHFRKTVTMKIGENELKLTYTTTPANIEHLNNIQPETYNAGYGTLTLTSDLAVDGKILKAGDYTIGAIMNGSDDWTMALYEGKPQRGAEPDMSKVVKLDSMFSKSEGTAHHVYFDIMPGHGKFEGNTVLIWHFGPLFLAGRIQ